MKRRTIYALCMAMLLPLLAGVALAEDASGRSLTTGLPTDRPYRPMMAQISNSPDARPQWNLGAADVVYEYIYWGPGHTRYTTIYNDEHPEDVGYLRGSRVYNCEMREAWDCPLITFGGQDSTGTSIYAFFKKHKVDAQFLIDGVRGSKGFWRQQDRVNPHNVMFSLAHWAENSWPMDEETMVPYEPRNPGLVFSDTPSAGEEAATTIIFQYSDEQIMPPSHYHPVYTYVPEAGHYLRAYDREQQVDGATGEDITAENIIVLCHELTFVAGNMSRPVIPLSDASGPITAYIGGTAVEGTWSRKNMEDPFTFTDAQGEPLRLRPGKTFIQMVPPEMYESGILTDGAVFYDNFQRYEAYSAQAAEATKPPQNDKES